MTPFFTWFDTVVSDSVFHRRTVSNRHSKVTKRSKSLPSYSSVLANRQKKNPLILILKVDLLAKASKKLMQAKDFSQGYFY